MGYNRTCPRDGRPHCSIVDALEDAYSGHLVFRVSPCFPLIRDDEGLLDDIRCKGLNRNNRHQQILIEDFNETLSDHLANSVIIFCSA